MNDSAHARRALCLKSTGSVARAPNCKKSWIPLELRRRSLRKGCDPRLGRSKGNSEISGKVLERWKGSRSYVWRAGKAGPAS